MTVTFDLGDTSYVGFVTIEASIEGVVVGTARIAVVG